VNINIDLWRAVNIELALRKEPQVEATYSEITGAVEASWTDIKKMIADKVVTMRELRSPR
jgi:hypothetical protein